MTSYYYTYFYTLFALLLNVSTCENPTTLDNVSTEIELIEEKPDNLEPTEEGVISQDRSKLKEWFWSEIEIPSYSWQDGAKFGKDLYIDIAFDPESIRKKNDHELSFLLDPLNVPAGAPSDFSYRSEIHTTPWPINHPTGTEQWIGWVYTFGDDYVIDPTSPITIFQNHPGVHGLSPQIEIELAGLNNPSPAQGGEIQIVNEAAEDRIVYPIKPMAGDQLEVVIHVIYGIGSEGLLQVWLNGTLYYNEKTSTVYADYPWGGNNKWGVYHHTFNDSASDVESSLDIGAGSVELSMGTLRMLTRTPDDQEYSLSAYDMVRPVQ